MNNYFSNKNEISRVNVIFAMILIMAGIAYYYLINLASDLRWVMMCGYFFLAIPALFTLVHGVVAKRCNIVLLGAEFLLLGVLGFVGKLLHGLNLLTEYIYFYNAAYAFSAILVFSFADKLFFGKKLIAKWWFALIMVIICVLPSVLVYVMPEETVSALMLVKNIAFIVVNLAAFALGVTLIVKKNNTGFAWAYTIYTFLTCAAYVFQLLGSSNVRWYNLFLMLALVSAPYVMMTAVKCNE